MKPFWQYWNNQTHHCHLHHRPKIVSWCYSNWVDLHHLRSILECRATPEMVAATEYLYTSDSAPWPHSKWMDWFPSRSIRWNCCNYLNLGRKLEQWCLDLIHCFGYDLHRPYLRVLHPQLTVSFTSSKDFAYSCYLESHQTKIERCWLLHGHFSFILLVNFVGFKIEYQARY